MTAFRLPRCFASSASGRVPSTSWMTVARTTTTQPCSSPGTVPGLMAFVRRGGNAPRDRGGNCARDSPAYGLGSVYVLDISGYGLDGRVLWIDSRQGWELFLLPTEWRL